MVALAPAAGWLTNASGAAEHGGANGFVWSSAVSGTNALNLQFNSTGVNPANNNNRANGCSVRCVQEFTAF